MNRSLLAHRCHSVLNSLSEDFISVSAALLGESGILEELGKRGAWSTQRAHAANVRLSSLDMAAEVPSDPQWYQQIVLKSLALRATAGVLHELPTHVFDMAREAQTAFRLLQSGRNLGKVILRVGLQHTSAALEIDFADLCRRLKEHTEAEFGKLLAPP